MQSLQMKRYHSGPSAFGHSSSHSTASPTDSSKLRLFKKQLTLTFIAVVYDQHGRPVRSRRPSVSEQPLSSNYLPAYIKETPAYSELSSSFFNPAFLMLK